MYLGIYGALASPYEPDRLEQACHSVRELMEKLPRQVMQTAYKKSENLKDKVRTVVDAWSRHEKALDAEFGVPTGEESEQTLHTLLARVGELSEWMSANRPDRRSLAKDALRALDVSEVPPLEAAEEDRVKAWLEWFDFFTNASHHRFRVNEAELRDHLEQLEALLIDLLVPSAVDDLQELDEIMGKTND